MSPTLIMVPQHVGRDTRRRDSRPRRYQSGHSCFWSCRLDVNCHILLLHVRLRRNYGYTDWTPRCTDILECWRQDRRNHHVVFCHPCTVLHRLLRNARKLKDGLGFCSRCGFPIFRVSCSLVLIGERKADVRQFLGQGQQHYGHAHQFCLARCHLLQLPEHDRYRKHLDDPQYL